MNTRIVTMSVVAAIAGSLTYVAASAAPDGAPGFQKPFRLQAGGERIDVEIGHAAPLVTDWDGDGIRDLLVGQFKGGHLRIYRNEGTDASPRFADFAMFQTRKALGSVPSG